MTGEETMMRKQGRPTRMRRARIFLLVALAGIASGCGEKGKDRPEEVAGPRVTGVEIVVAGAGPREMFAEAAGTVRAKKIAYVAPQVMGRITSLPVAEGTTVKKGAVLATIDDTAIRSRFSAAQAMVAEAEAAYEEAQRGVVQVEAARDLAEKTFVRYRELHEEKVITTQEFDEIEVRRTVAAKEYERALDRRAQVAAKIGQARAQADAARAELSYTRVTAPFPGVVTGKRVDAGSMAVPGQPVVVLEDTSLFRVEAPVPESFLGTLKEGDRVRVVLEGEAGGATDGTVAEVVPAVDPVSRTFTVKVDLPRGARVRTGMFGRVLFPAGKDTILVVPRAAIAHVGGYDALYTVTPDNVARLVMVRTGRTFGDEVEILAGLSAGARVAVSPVDRLVDGARVELRQ